MGPGGTAARRARRAVGRCARARTARAPFTASEAKWPARLTGHPALRPRAAALVALGQSNYLSQRASPRPPTAAAAAPPLNTRACRPPFSRPPSSR